MNSNGKRRMNRIISIDVMRTLALILMVICHFQVYLSNSHAGNTADQWTFFVANHVLGDFAAPWFLFLMGVSQILSAKKRESVQASIGRRAFSRGVFLFLIGLVFAGVAFGPSEIWGWDILPLIGVSLVMCFLCRNVPSWVLITGCALVIAISPSLRGFVNFTNQWGGHMEQVPVISDFLPGILYDPAEEYRVIWSFRPIITGFFLTGYFPLLPWIAFPLMGVVIGRRIIMGRIADDVPLLSTLGAILSVSAIAVAYASTFQPDVLPITSHIAPLSFYPDSTSMIALQIGCTLLVFSALYVFFDNSRKPADALSPFVVYCTRMSRFSLSFYVIHHLSIFWPLWLWKFYSGEFLYEEALSPVEASVLSVVFTALFFIFLNYWNRKGGKFSLEWLQSRVVG